MIQSIDLEELKRYQPGGDLYEPARVIRPTIHEAIDALCELRVMFFGSRYSAALGVAIEVINEHNEQFISNTNLSENKVKE